jgi:glycosyltransferase involved in cell wall biosynthesis
LLPKRTFLGVRGAYDAQEWRCGRYDNMTIWDNQPIIDTVLDATRVVLMPSHTESWGRVAVEAGHRGIPSICHPASGLLESLDWGTKFIDRNHPLAWAEEIERLSSDPGYFTRRGKAARNRSHELEVLSGGDQLRLMIRMEEVYGPGEDT